ncbi:iron reductase domain protein [Plenodomus tracheiphilus IPT5]|uniref:Iron reductase domain protein n=1 Tax=Plenodomus tracheiphilus IPT5 TaxID=1408161 RepID=A0A6A7B2C3_9PLEO|nr:iron reductase domain protein [Plenodomus tracheiphilus IPT5]
MDPDTEITFQQYTSGNGFSFGVALPETNGDAFIGRISASVEGWAAVSMIGSMEDGVMVVAWPSGDDIVSSLRTTGDSTDPDAAVTTIPEGTFINETGFTYTFLCEGCVIPGNTLGYAVSNTVPVEPAIDSSPLEIPEGGFGTFDFDAAAAQSANFAEWADLAGEYDTTSKDANVSPEKRGLRKVTCAGRSCNGSSIMYRKKRALRKVTCAGMGCSGS